jgi:ribonucleoside-diphosphate reductase alpha chain
MIEATLPGVFEIGFAFNQWTLGEETMQRLGFTAEEYNGRGFNMLSALGFSDSEIREANDVICGRQAIEGAPGLLDEHLEVFDTANKNGKYGERYIHHIGHIKMMAAAQPFISGAISKTINMPNEATVADIEESYQMSWELGLKAMALYRDGSKASQPLSSTSDEGVSDEEVDEVTSAIEREVDMFSGMYEPGMSPSEAYQAMPRPRFLLPSRRAGYTQEARIGGHKVFLRTGEYEDGTLGEVFLDLAKEGATLRGILGCFAIAVSKGLQYGVPLEEYVDTFTFQTFEPRGMVEGHPNIKMSNSIVDYVFRALGIEYLHRDELAQVPPERSGDLPEPPKGAAADAGLQLDLTEAAMEQDIEAQMRAARFADNGSAPDAEQAVAAVAASHALAPAHTAQEVQTAAVQAVLADKMGDAPLCDTCGHITVRNGSCYRCFNCGDSKGCS